ncbi:type II toxin-antitoxin system HicA family toxin [Candidatus Uhrbacteria bacterium]|nr:type II toxin-antitoxin system HicA family toxin [Candidatus Uhrbacteria bacterium]
MPKPPLIKPRQLASALQCLGFALVRQRGSHAIYRHTDGRMAVIPMHSKEIPLGTLRGILDDIGVSLEVLQVHLS